MSRTVVTRPSRRASRRVSRALHPAGDHETRYSPRRLVRAELRAQDLELELFED